MDMKTKRKIFEIVKSHMLSQNQKCQNDTGDCLYRHGTLKCAIGALIPDNLYRPEMDNVKYLYDTFGTIDSEIILVKHNPLVQEVLSSIYGQLDLEFLTQLQEIHDSAKVTDWEEVLNNFEERELDEVSLS